MRKVLLAVALTAFGIGAGTACTPDVRCGAVITTDTRLVKDLADCEGTALIIGADGVTLDLGGHSVRSLDGVGLRIEGRNRTTIKNGAVEGFTTGIAASDARNLTIGSVAILGGDYNDDGPSQHRVGLLLERVGQSRITRSSIAGYHAVVLLDSDHNRVYHVTSQGDADNSKQLYLRGSDHNRLVDNVFAGGGGQSALLVASHDNTLDRNDFSNSNGGALAIVNSDRNTIRSNRTSSESSGLSIISSTDSLVEGNLATAQTSGPAKEIHVQDSSRITLRGNHVGPINVTGSSGTKVLDNVLEPSFDDDGLWVDADSTDTQVSGNHVTAFAYDGIKIEAPGTVLRDNVSNGNGGLGINAVPGVIDGGGNSASGNGDQRQCLNVRCSLGNQ